MRKDKNEYIINDINAFVESTRTLVFNSFGKVSDDETNDIDTMLEEVKDEHKEEFDSVLSHEESHLIIKNYIKIQKNKTTNSIRYILTDDMFMKIIECLNERMVSNMLRELVKKGFLETAFDEESNDFIFWTKD
jgi:DNA-binding HxlR family transcriptional regulator